MSTKALSEQNFDGVGFMKLGLKTTKLCVSVVLWSRGASRISSVESSTITRHQPFECTTVENAANTEAVSSLIFPFECLRVSSCIFFFSFFVF